MLDQEFFCHRHLTTDAYAALEADVLTLRDRELILLHLENCEKCMDSYLECLTEESLIKPPEGLNERIMEAVICEPQKRASGSNFRFLKLAVAVCLTMLLFTGGGLLDYLSKVPNEMHSAKLPVVEESISPPTFKKNPLAKYLNGFQQEFNKFARDIMFSFNNIGDETDESK